MDYVLLSNKGEMLKPLKETLNDCNKEAFKPIIKGKEDTMKLKDNLTIIKQDKKTKTLYVDTVTYKNAYKVRKMIYDQLNEIWFVMEFEVWKWMLFCLFINSALFIL